MTHEKMETMPLERENKLSTVLTKLFFTVALLTLGACYVIAIVTCAAMQAMTALFTVIFAGLAAGIAYLIHRYKLMITDRKLYAFTGVYLLVSIAFQVLTVYYLSVEPTWDFGGIFISAREYVERGSIITHEHYFERFYNNAGLLAIEILYFKLFSLLGIPVDVTQGHALNVLFINAAIVFMMLFVRKMWGNDRALFYLVNSLGFTPYILYAPIFYSDTMTMLFISLPLYLFACFLKGKKRGMRAAQLVAISLILSLGYKTKGTVLILMIAMLAYIVVNFEIKRIIASVLLLILPFSAFYVAFDYAMEAKRIVKTEYLDEIEFPMEYWLYMGLSPDSKGGFDNNDFEEVYTAGCFDEKQAVARAGIERRLEEYGFGGMMLHLGEKASITYRDGGYFIGALLSRGEPKFEKVGPLEMFRADSPSFDYYKVWSNSYNYVLLLALLIGMVLGLAKRRFDINAMLYLSLFGLMLFLLIWETRSRYLLNFTPVMIALAADSLLRLAEIISDKRARKTENKLEENHEANIYPAQ